MGLFPALESSTDSNPGFNLNSNPDPNPNPAHPYHDKWSSSPERRNPEVECFLRWTPGLTLTRLQPQL